MSINKTLLSLACTSLLLAGCNSDDDDNNNPSIDAQLKTLITAHELTGTPVAKAPLTEISDPLAQLGMQLFFTKALGGDQDSACVTCHHPLLGGGDNLTLSIGTTAVTPDLLGPGRTHKTSDLPTVPRNAPTTFNIAFWNSSLFLDGRVEFVGDDPTQIRTPDSAFDQPDANAGTDLTQAQARFPVTSDAEMRGHTFEAGESNAMVREHLQGRLGNYGVGAGELTTNNWLAAFQQAFNSQASAENLITFDHIAQAIAAYENSQNFISSPWANYVKGDNNAIDNEQKQGAKLFFTAVEDGGAGCSSCHSGDFFTDNDYHVVAFPQIGEGKGNGDNGTDDFGRFRESKQADDKYAFRTPTLLNIEATGPFGHAGTFQTLEAVVRYHLDPEAGLASYDHSLKQLDQFAGSTEVVYPDSVANSNSALQQWKALSAANKSQLHKASLTDAQIGQLVSFLEALTDPCVVSQSCLSAWIPSVSQDPDGLQVKAVDKNGNPLSL